MLSYRHTMSENWCGARQTSRPASTLRPFLRDTPKAMQVILWLFTAWTHVAWNQSASWTPFRLLNVPSFGKDTALYHSTLGKEVDENTISPSPELS